jgi:ABC-type branched-subunit amino acid transport system substrate-binding protein
MRTSRFWAWWSAPPKVGLLGLVAAVAVAFACDSGASAVASTHAHAASGSTVSIMAVSDVSQVESYPNDWAGSQAAALAINKAGGINGHKIKIIQCNENGTANGVEACGREAVSDHVIAATSIPILYANVFVPVLKSANIADLNSGLSPTEEALDANSFPLGAGASATSDGQAILLKDLGAKKDTTLVFPNPASETIAQEVKSGAVSLGDTYTGDTQISFTTTDYAPIAQAIKASGADGVGNAVSGQASAQTIEAAAQAGISLKYAGLAEPFDHALVKQMGSVANGVGLVYTVPPVEAASSKFPYLEDFVKDMKAAQKAGIPNATNRDATAVLSWLGIEAIADVAAKVKGSLTAAAVLKQMSHTLNLSVDGFMWSPGAKGPAKYPRDSTGDVWLGKIEHGTFTLLSNKPINAYAAVKK